MDGDSPPPPPPGASAPAPAPVATLPLGDARSPIDRRAAVAIGSDGRIRSTGGSVGALIGHDAEGLTGRSFAELVAPEDRDVVLAAISRVLVDGSDETVRVRICDAMDIERPTEMALCLLNAPDGDLVVASLSADRDPGADGADHPDHAGREMVLRHDLSLTLVTLTDETGAIRHVSSGCTALVGWSPEELAELGQAGVVHPLDLERFRAIGADLRSQSGAVRTSVVRVLCRDGSHAWVRAVGMNLLHDPAVRGVVTAFTDATHQVRAEMAEAVEQLWARGVVEPGHDLVLLGDQRGVVTLAGAGMGRLFGIDPEKLLGIPTFDGLDEADRQQLRRAYAKALSDPRLVGQARVRVHRPQGDTRWIRMEVTNRLDDPDLRAVLMVFHDVTQRFEADEAVRASERRFRKLVQSTGDILLVVDREWRVRWASPAVERVLGHDPDAVVGLPLESVAHLADREVAVTHVRAALGGDPPPPTVVRCRHADGSFRHLSFSATDLRDDPDVDGVLFTATDVTAQVETEIARARLSLVLEASPDLTIIATAGQSGLRFNRSMARLLGIEGHSTAAADILAARLPPWVERRFLDDVVPAVETSGLWEGELAILDAEGDSIPLSVVVVGLHGDHGEIETLAAIGRDISERKAFEDQLEHQATHDPLTSLPNRTLMLDRLRVAMGRAGRQSTLVAVLFLDLDNFKVINDSLGHTAGDSLLIQLAQRIEGAVRPGDTVARFGGDEFAVLCEDLSDPAEAVAIATRIEEAVAAPLMLEGREVTVTVSIGVAVSDGALDAGSVVRDADAAMYQAKARGRSRTEVFDAAMHVQAVDRLELESALRRALDRGEMRTVYQPQIDLRTGRVNGGECLVRWQHPDRGLLLPGAFLPIAEETGLIVGLGNWVLSEACATVARLRAAHPEASDFVMSVNLSARQLASPRLLDDVAAIVGSSGVPPESLILEVTETDLMDVHASGEALARIHELGLGVAIDDFGTGWSSLRYLRHFPVDMLKIDRSFVSGLGRDAEDEAIVGAVIDLGHALGLVTVAEGVEDDVQMRRLAELGCDAAQGWRVSRPLLVDDLLAFMAEPPSLDLTES